MVYCASGAVLDRFGDITKDLETDYGPHITLRKIYSEFDGYNPVAAAKSAAALQSGLAEFLSADLPGLVVVNHDRREVLAAAAAAANLNIRVAHVGAGERTGSIDDKCRDAISHLSEYFFPATLKSAYRTYALTGDWERIYTYGCPSIDLARNSLSAAPVDEEELSGAGAAVDPKYPFIFALQHPDTTVWKDSYQQTWQTLEALERANKPVLMQWPNQDAGADGIAKAIRQFRNFRPAFALRTIPNLPPDRYLRLLSQCSCLVGNSSSGIRESAYLGLPVVNIGARQHGRERADNVLDVGYNYTDILGAIQRQLAHGKYPSSGLYGTGNAGKQIAEKLLELA